MSITVNNNQKVIIDSSNPILQKKIISLIKKSEYNTDIFLREVEKEKLEYLDSSDISGSLYLFFLNLISDIYAWGGKFAIENSKLTLRMPDYSSKTAGLNDSQIRLALKRLKNIQDTKSNFSPEINHKDIMGSISNSNIELVSSISDKEAGNIFKNCVSTWSMPYNTREGRQERFVIFYHPEKFSAPRYPLGILEIGDDAPKNTLRDNLLGMDRTHFSDKDLILLRKRFKSIRHSLRLDHFENVNIVSSGESLYKNLDTLRATREALKDKNEKLFTIKAYRYLINLVIAEHGCKTKNMSEIKIGLGILKDICLPRVNAEMTICGSVEPFNELVGGKLVASFAGHPFVRNFTNKPIGSILASIFDENKLNKIIPRHGALLITTKGLYPGHSAQYNRVKVGLNNNVKFKKIGNTIGTGTSSHLSDLTSKAAINYLKLTTGDISREFGSGGSKRGRMLSKAVSTAGLPKILVQASISRPVYGLSLCRNISRVIFFGENPDWIIDKELNDETKYCEVAFRNWFDLPIVQKKIKELS